MLSRGSLNTFPLIQVFPGLVSSLAFILLSGLNGFCNSSGEFPGAGSYSDWKQAVNSDEDGVDYAQKGNYTMALQCYDEAIQKYPFDALFYFNKAIALKKTGKTKESLSQFKKAIELEPKFASAWYNLGNAQQEEHDFPASENSFNQALKLEPNHMHAWFNLGESLLWQKKLREAKAAFTQAQALPCKEQDKKDIADYLADIERQLKTNTHGNGG